MKTRRIAIAAAVGLLSASPVWAAGSYEGSLWTDLVAQRQALTAQPTTLAAAMMRERAYEGDLFDRLASAHRQYQRGTPEAKGAMLAGEAAPTPLNRLDLRPYVSIYEELAMRYSGRDRS